MLVGRADIIDPLGRDSVAKQLVFRISVEERRCRRKRLLLRHVDRYHDLLNRLPDLDDLRRTGARVRLELPPLGPVVGVVVMVHVTKEEAVGRAVDDDPNVRADPDRPEVVVLRPVQAVEAEPRPRRIHLEVEYGRLDGLLLVPREAGEAVGEGVGDEEVHVRSDESAYSRSALLGIASQENRPRSLIEYRKIILTMTLL
jgi:hypothetical protein